MELLLAISRRTPLEEHHRIRAARHVRQLAAENITALEVPDDYLVGRIVATDMVDAKTGELLASANDEITAEQLENFRKAGIETVPTLYVNDLDRGAYISHTLRIDNTKTQLEALCGTRARGSTFLQRDASIRTKKRKI